MHLELTFSVSGRISAWAAQHEVILVQHSDLGAKVLSWAKANLFIDGDSFYDGYVCAHQFKYSQ